MSFGASLVKVGHKIAGTSSIVLREKQENSDPYSTEAQNPVDHQLDATAGGPGKQYRDGDAIEVNDVQVDATPVDGVDPEMFWVVVLDGVEHQIIQYDPFPKVGNPIHWTFIVRK